jgi:hypothetical protein
MAATPRFLDALVALARHDVELIVVGGVAAVLGGAPISTFDLDVLYRTSGENLARLATALGEIEAVYRDPAGRRIAPDAERLGAGGHNLLLTRCGPLDALGKIGQGATYEDLLPRSHEVEVEGITVRVLDLAAVIETKEQAGRSKDLATLEVLRATLRLKEGS